MRLSFTPPTGRNFRRIWLAVALVLTACSFHSRQPAVPKALAPKAEVVGFPGVRAMGDEMSEFYQEVLDSIKREEAYLGKKRGGLVKLPPAHFLALSGGGDDGAFGAGLLAGWSASGLRPEFKLVTGISTGALLAPFAFLGLQYDETLRQVYTNTSPEDISESRGPYSIVFDDAMADNAPLESLLERHVTKKLLEEVAQEYEKGRLLLIATTNLDARQAVIWNMTKIAASRNPDALNLFRKIMLASAAIPGAFPPSMIEVEVDGKRYQEMHVDGGATAQVFNYPTSVRMKDLSKEAGIVRERHLYVIRNARLEPDWDQVDRQALSIAGRAIASLIQTQAIGDLYQIYATAKRDNIDYNLAYIPESFNAPHEEEFDTTYMRKLFQTGYELAVKGYPWKKLPPGM